MSKEKMKRLSLQPQVQLLKYSVAADISKDKFDACISVIDCQQRVTVISTKVFKNQESGFKEFFKWANRYCKSPIPIVFTMEATGVYYEHLAFYLHRRDCYVSVVLPNKAKKYLQSLGIKSKNDKIDAQGLSRMGAEQKLNKWEAPSEAIMNLRSITRQRENLQEMRTQTTNQLSSFRCCEYINPDIISQLEATINFLDQQIKQTAVLIKKEIKKDKVMEAKIKKITAIKGVGLITAATIIAETNAFKLFENQRQLVKYAGYDVIENQSGKHVGKTKISKKGNSHIRRILHLPAFSVVASEEPVFKNLYERVYARTNFKMKGYVAVQRKLLTLIYTLWTKDKEYDRNYRNEQSKMQSESSSLIKVEEQPQRKEETENCLNISNEHLVMQNKSSSFRKVAKQPYKIEKTENCINISDEYLVMQSKSFSFRKVAKQPYKIEKTENCINISDEHLVMQSKSFSFRKVVQKPKKSRRTKPPTLDELPYKASQEVLFPRVQK